MTLPLESFRVLDLTRLLPGPYCTLLLADFGADVIKIEAPNGGDYARGEEPKIGDQEQSAIFASLNRNKRSVSIDLKSELGKKMFIDLVKTADVVVESFRPGVMKRLGLDYEELKKYNSKIIYCAITGYGQSGPYAESAGHDLNYLSYSGMLNLQGERSGKPLLSSVQIADIGGGSLMAAIGILLSIIESKSSDKGQFIDISMLDGAVSWMQTILPNFFVSKSQPQRGELPLSGGKACYEVYKTQDNRYLAVAALEEKFWIHFCKLIGKEEFIAKLNAPLEEQTWMKEEIQCIISKKSLKEWTALFKGIEACVSPVLTAEEMMEDPQIKHRHMIEEVDYPGRVKMKQLGIPIKLSRTEGEIRRPSPRLGEHNNEILRELGYSNEQIPNL
ncbi:Crotonobetainyl-CoA:carnitine CoA-transferase CaiB [Alteribacillus persepolensis]|uniref:Crotonobetainyl-CoA:carnitine CoA-transferase CaiB n=1 Tax=Alteribacillus persepolensis TaxID=568899 RepID=A0A1G8HSW3_9BACI|nr:CaiB/BaiF CoA-transferase family protein [Alteribacillus persepolensis]SDI09580.1 Crotonobetainyl-CoA:carnitine CoA-transferase CaiB [Alteribacillus persepolensis]